MSLSNCLRSAWALGFYSALLSLSACTVSHQDSGPPKAEKAPTTSTDQSKTGPWVKCEWPYATELNQVFTISCSLQDPSADTKVVHVEAETDQRVKYDPPKFDLKPGKVQLVKVTVSRSRSGVASLELHPDGLDTVDMTVEVGFQGHLKLVPNVTISSDSPTTAVVTIVDDNGKPMAVDIKLLLNVQAVGASLRWGQNGESEETGWNETLSPKTLNPRASVSPQFQIRPSGKLGGTIQLLANIQLPDGGAMLAQESFLIPVQPARPWPIIFAAGGSLLFWLYRFLQAPKGGWAVVFQIMAALFGGVIAYLFAGFDLLGLKLDPNVLKTYAIFGFLFGYVGIEVLLANRFKPGSTGTAPPNVVAKP